MLFLLGACQAAGADGVAVAAFAPASPAPLAAAIEPLADPVTLRYQEVPRFALSLETVTTRGGRVVQHVTMTGTGSVRAAEDALAWDIDVERVKLNGRLFEPMVPVASLSLRTDHRGVRASRDVSFPAFTPLGLRPPREGSPEYEKLVRTLGRTAAILPAAAIAAGEEVFDRDRLLDDLLAILEEGGARVIRNGLTSRASGTTTRGGRPQLVVEVDGTIQLAADGASRSLAVDGQALLDQETGLPTAGLLRVAARGGGTKGDYEVSLTSRLKIADRSRPFTASLSEPDPS